MSVTKEQYIEDLPITDKVKYNYKLTREDVLSEDGLLMIQCMVRDGMTMDAISKTIGINPQTFCVWRQKYKELREACRRGKQLVDYQVENALLRAALGYKTETVKMLISKNASKDGSHSVREERTVTEVGPNVTACLAWLNNRKPEQWKKNRDNSILEYDDKASGITINIVKGQEQDTDNAESNLTDNSSLNGDDDDWD